MMNKHSHPHLAFSAMNFVPAVFDLLGISASAVTDARAQTVSREFQRAHDLRATFLAAYGVRRPQSSKRRSDQPGPTKTEGARRRRTLALVEATFRPAPVKKSARALHEERMRAIAKESTQPADNHHHLRYGL